MPYRTPASSHTHPNAEGPDTLRAADHNAVAAWLGHVQAGRIGTRLETPDAVRAIVLANERVICGDGTLPIW